MHQQSLERVGSMHLYIVGQSIIHHITSLTIDMKQQICRVLCRAAGRIVYESSCEV